MGRGKLGAMGFGPLNPPMGPLRQEGVTQKHKVSGRSYTLLLAEQDAWKSGVTATSSCGWFCMGSRMLQPSVCAASTLLKKALSSL